jgi:hypothetical protein
MLHVKRTRKLHGFHGGGIKDVVPGAFLNGDLGEMAVGSNDGLQNDFSFLTIQTGRSRIPLQFCHSSPERLGEPAMIRPGFRLSRRGRCHSSRRLGRSGIGSGRGGRGRLRRGRRDNLGCRGLHGSLHRRLLYGFGRWKRRLMCDDRLGRLEWFRLLRRRYRLRSRLRRLCDLRLDRLDGAFLKRLHRRDRLPFHRWNRLLSRFNRLWRLDLRMHHLHALLRRNPIRGRFHGLGRSRGHTSLWLHRRNDRCAFLCRQIRVDRFDKGNLPLKRLLLNDRAHLRRKKCRQHHQDAVKGQRKTPSGKEKSIFIRRRHGEAPSGEPHGRNRSSTQPGTGSMHRSSRLCSGTAWRTAREKQRGEVR